MNELGRRLRFIPAGLRRAETMAGFLSAVVIGFVTGLVCFGLIAQNKKSDEVNVVCVIGVTLLVIFDVNVLQAAWAFRNQRMPAVDGAIEVSTWMPPSRWAAAFWCILRFLNGLAFAVIIEFYAGANLFGVRSGWIANAGILTTLILVFCLTYASNMYLVLAMGAFTQSRAKLEWVWSLRLIWDSAVTLIAGALLLFFS